MNFGGREQEVPCPYYVNATIMEQPTALLTIDDKCECSNGLPHHRCGL